MARIRHGRACSVTTQHPGGPQEGELWGGLGVCWSPGCCHVPHLIWMEATTAQQPHLHFVNHRYIQGYRGSQPGLWHASTEGSKTFLSLLGLTSLLLAGQGSEGHRGEMCYLQVPVKVYRKKEVETNGPAVALIHCCCRLLHWPSDGGGSHCALSVLVALLTMAFPGFRLTFVSRAGTQISSRLMAYITLQKL